MEVIKLSDDELLYELEVRGFGHAAPISLEEQRALLRILLKVKSNKDQFLPLDPKCEIATCTVKVSECNKLIQAISGNRSDESYRLADTKLSHLLGRVDRIVTEDVNLQKSKSVLLKAILYLMESMENRVQQDAFIDLKVSHSDDKEKEVVSGTLTIINENMADQSGKTSNLISEDNAEKEFFVNLGVAIKMKGNRGDVLPTGTLTIHRRKRGFSIEWKQTDVGLTFKTDSDTEWDVVDAVKRRTCSTSSNAESLHHPAIHIEVTNLKSFKVKDSKRQISFRLKNGHHYSFLFQAGNEECFVQNLNAILYTKRLARHGKSGTYMVTGPREEILPIAPTPHFRDLTRLPAQIQSYPWHIVKNLQQRPYETAMQTFSKLTNAFHYHVEEERPVDPEVADLLKMLNTEDNPVERENSLESGYTIIEGVKGLTLPPRPPVVRGQPLSQQQFQTALDADGRIFDVEYLKQLIFNGGMEAKLRPIVWKYLLGYYPWNYTREECSILRVEKAEEYSIMKNQWESMTPSQEDRFSHFKDRKSRLEKDVNRTDRAIEFYAGDGNLNLVALNNVLMTYVMYNFDLGYVQGMSDLLSPILSVMKDEVDAFWCFVGFMNRMSHNFDMNQAGMKKQLSQIFEVLCVVAPKLAEYLKKNDSGHMYFCFRWMLVWFKREFSHMEVMELWEVLWTDLPAKNFHILMCVAILDQQKDVLMAEGNGLSEILKCVNELSQTMNLDEILSRAQGIYMQLDAAGDALPDGIKRIIGKMPSKDSFDLSDNSDDTSGPGSESQTKGESSKLGDKAQFGNGNVEDIYNDESKLLKETQDYNEGDLVDLN